MRAATSDWARAPRRGLRGLSSQVNPATFASRAVRHIPFVSRCAPVTLFRKRECPVHDPRCKENQQLVPILAESPPLEEHSEHRNITEEGNLVDVATCVSGVDASDDCGVTVVDEELRDRLTLEDGRVTVGAHSTEVGLVTRDLHVHGHRAVAGDVRRDVELELRLLEGCVDALGADLREGNQRTLRDRRFVVVQASEPAES